jgi:hypothetical protein
VLFCLALSISVLLLSLLFLVQQHERRKKKLAEEKIKSDLKQMYFNVKDENAMTLE